MDPLSRADETLARARARRHVVTPDDATSPMDAVSTVQIPRVVIQSLDPQTDPELTMIVPPSPPSPRGPEANRSEVSWPAWDDRRA